MRSGDRRSCPVGESSRQLASVSRCTSPDAHNRNEKQRLVPVSDLIVRIATVITSYHRSTRREELAERVADAAETAMRVRDGLVAAKDVVAREPATCIGLSGSM